MRSVRRLLKLGLFAALSLGAGCVFLFAAYGLSQGYDVPSGFLHLFELSPAPAESNPRLDDVAWQRVSWVADIENRALHESSGLTASSLHDDVFWSINDSGSGPELYALGLDGADLGTWQVRGVQAVDWEAMDAFVLDGTAYLVIGDIGDNFRWRSHVSLLVVPEPTSLTETPRKLSVAWRVDFTYPNGKRDAEALAVDASQNLVYVLSKRRYPAEVFRLPLRGEKRVQAERIAELGHLPRPVQRDYDEGPGARFRHAPTGMDLARGHLLLTTYKHAYLYRIDAIQDAPLRVRLPSVGQREALSFARNSHDTAYVTRERHDGKGVADLFRIELRAQPSAQTPAVEIADGQ